MPVFGPSQSGPCFLAVVGSEYGEVDTTWNHTARNQSPHLFRDDYDSVGTIRDDSGAKALKQPTLQHVASVKCNYKGSLPPKPSWKRRLPIMGVHDVIVHPARRPKNRDSALQIVQFGSESTNIDDVDHVTEFAQPLRLLPHQSSVPG